MEEEEGEKNSPLEAKKSRNEKPTEKRIDEIHWIFKVNLGQMVVGQTRKVMRFTDIVLILT